MSGKNVVSSQSIFSRAISVRGAGLSQTIEVQVFENEPDTAAQAALFVARQLDYGPGSNLLLPTGRTPLATYSELVAMVGAGQLSLKGVQTFNLDEFYGLPADHAGSYRTYMGQVLFDRVDIPTDHIHLLNGAASHPLEECRAYEAKIKAAGGIDLAVLGIGTNGHIGFNEPGSSLDSRTRLVTLRSETRLANAFLFNNNSQEVPQSALTVGIGTILEARRILLIATGSSKAQAVAAMLTGPVTPDLPASCLQLHPDVTLLLDKEAALELRRLYTQ